ncbi:ribose 1,5-bisphosphokinase [Rhizobium halophytocola]|uniref:ribose 1,5-bisphosphate phosphokinase n=2 Tax=Rhizobium halophytocola TaxID=735519 RepID=A0ABS4E182_9HYPH|nr:ribose 1,5-bisphosphokinase [Rhizobium halophytocola]
MNEALAHFGARGDLHLVQRVITRPVDAGGENHRAVEHPEFAALKDAGAFAVSWDAHGLRYGIPAAVHEKLALGHLVIANGSRSALPRFAEVFDPLLVINIVARPEVLASRLEKRGRETREDILRRLKRGSLEVRGPFHVVTIDNSEDLATATRQLVATLSPLLGAPQTA